MLRCSNRRASTSLTNVAFGCTAITIITAVAALFGDFYSEASAPSHAHEGWVAPSNFSPADLYEHVAPSVVTIIMKDEKDKPIGNGSGFLVDREVLADRDEWFNSEKQFPKLCFGYVLTNYHVIRAGVAADLKLFNGDEAFVFRVLAEDEDADLALLLVLFPSDTSPKGIPFARQSPRVLTTVYAIGSPKGLSGSASEGKVSGVRESETGQQWLQTTAPISPGSSGGPLLLSDGTLAGVTTMFLKDAQNLNFAIPVSAVRTFLATSECRPRNVAEGANMGWHWRTAFADMKVAVTSPAYTDDQRHAAELLERMWKEDSREDADAQEAIDHYRRIVDLAQDANKSLPNEFKYLMHCLVGSAAHNAANETSAANRKTFTKEESEALHRDNGYAKLAIRHFKRAITLKPDSPIGYMWLYHCYALSGNWADAFVAADSLVWLMPRSADALEYRGNCYFELNQPEAGLAEKRAAIDLAPRDGMIRYFFAEKLVEFGEYEEAIAQYEAAVELLDDSNNLRRALKMEAQYNLGRAYKKSGNLAKAISAFAKAKDMGYIADYCDREIAECRQRQR